MELICSNCGFEYTLSEEGPPIITSEGIIYGGILMAGKCPDCGHEDRLNNEKKGDA